MIEHEILEGPNFIGSVCKFSCPTTFSDSSEKNSKEFLVTTVINLDSHDSAFCSLLTKVLKANVGLDEIIGEEIFDVAGGARLMINIPW